jgi:hypothetical protein
MSVLPLPKWVRNTRRTILCVGIGWPAIAYVISLGHPAGGIWFAIGSLFLAIIFLPGVLLLTFVLPTYRSRIIAIPPLLLFIFWLISRQSHTYDGFSLPVPMLLWICSFMAIAMLIPQWSSIELAARRLFRRQTTWY